MALAKNQAVVVGLLRVIEVILQVRGEEDAHQVGGGHRRGRMPRTGGSCATDAVNAQLGGEALPERGLIVLRVLRLSHKISRVYSVDVRVTA